MKKIVVTTSWDDGNKLDLRLAELLNKYSLKGTFYIPQRNEFRSLSEGDLKALAQGQEIGAHTLSHPDLTRIGLGEAGKEISGSKKYLEDFLGREIKVFCYPGGRFNQRIKDLAKRAGFLGARTVERGHVNNPDDFFEFGVTLQAYPLSLSQKLRFFTWSRFAKKAFDQVLKNGGVYHLWGHSWEIEKYGLWQELENVFKHIANKAGVIYSANGEFLGSL